MTEKWNAFICTTDLEMGWRRTSDLRTRTP
jgi:hypothetical protein